MSLTRKGIQSLEIWSTDEHVVSKLESHHVINTLSLSNEQNRAKFSFTVWQSRSPFSTLQSLCLNFLTNCVVRSPMYRTESQIVVESCLLSKLTVVFWWTLFCVIWEKCWISELAIRFGKLFHDKIFLSCLNNCNIRANKNIERLFGC